MNDPVDFLLKSLLVMACMFLGWLFFFAAPLGARATNECLRRGYPEARTTWSGDAYCIGRDSMGASVVFKLPP